MTETFCELLPIKGQNEPAKKIMTYVCFQQHPKFCTLSFASNYVIPQKTLELVSENG